MNNYTKKKNIKLTILMPLYNRGTLLQRALDSIYMQKVDFKYRIIILDDASTDDSLEIAQINKKKYFNIKIITSKENQGLLKNIFIGHDMLQESEYFCVLDPDDYWIDSQYLQNAINFLEANPTYTIYSSNINVLNQNSMMTPYIQSHIPFATSTYDLFLNEEKTFIPSTQATLFRNVVYSDGVPAELKDYIEKYEPQGFRADTFRFIAHLRKGSAYFENKITAVYDTTSSGIWTNASYTLRHLQNILIYLHLANYFAEDKAFYHKFAYKNYLHFIKSSKEEGIYQYEKIKLLHLVQELLTFKDFVSAYEIALSSHSDVIG